MRLTFVSGMSGFLLGAGSADMQRTFCLKVCVSTPTLLSTEDMVITLDSLSSVQTQIATDLKT